MSWLNFVVIVSFLQLVIISYKGCLCTISCFTCSSRNGSDTDCEDPFHPGPNAYTERCKVPKRGHIGEFPAHFCIKVTGTSDNTHEKLVIRRCVLGNMENQCGKFRLENDTLHGCILTCDLDGCNSSNHVTSNGVLTMFLLVLSTVCIFTTAGGSDHSTDSLTTRITSGSPSSSSSSSRWAEMPSICTSDDNIESTSSQEEEEQVSSCVT